MEGKHPRKKAWPKNCPWPEPIPDGCGMEDLRGGLRSRNSRGGMPSGGVRSGKPIPAQRDPAMRVRDAIGYEFLNQNLLRQAFTRRAFAQEYGLRGCSEELEFLGDAVLNLMVSRKLICQLSRLDNARTDAPFRPDEGVTEGVLSRLRSEHVCKEQLAARMQALQLDGLILYGTGEAPSDSSREDALEALLGAVAIDSGWHWQVLEQAAEKLIPVRKEKLRGSTQSNCYEKLNAWHQRRYGYLPEYSFTGQPPEYHCFLRIALPESKSELLRHHWEVGNASSRSGAREIAARKAYDFLVDAGLWVSPSEAIDALQPEDAINQLQELYQKKALRQPPSYSFQQLSPEEWQCVCLCEGMITMRFDSSKKKAKKGAAGDMLNRVLGWPAISNDPETGDPDWRRLETERARARNIQYLYKLSTYERNWDGEGALPFSLKLIRDVCCAIQRLDEQPEIEPTELCCIRLTFGNRKSGTFLEIELYEGDLIGVRKHRDGGKITQGCELFEIPAVAADWRRERDALHNSQNENP